MLNDQQTTAARVQKRQMSVMLLLLGICIMFVLHIGLGKTMLTPEEVMRALFDRGGDEGFRHIVWNLRLPRALIAIVAGMMLGTAGAILQVIMRNPLVEPGLIGASAGAVCFAVLWMSYASDAFTKAVPLPFVALIGGLGAVMLVYALNARQQSNGARLALIGVIMTAILQSAVSLLLLQNQRGYLPFSCGHSARLTAEAGAAGRCFGHGLLLDCCSLCYIRDRRNFCSSEI